MLKLFDACMINANGPVRRASKVGVPVPSDGLGVNGPLLASSDAPNSVHVPPNDASCVSTPACSFLSFPEKAPRQSVAPIVASVVPMAQAGETEVSCAAASDGSAIIEASVIVQVTMRRRVVNPCVMSRKRARNVERTKHPSKQGPTVHDCC